MTNTGENQKRPNDESVPRRRAREADPIRPLIERAFHRCEPFNVLSKLSVAQLNRFATTVLHHVTWFVNSAAHVWGKQDYATGDQSRNNWWVGWLAFGEGWHNNHHAFEYSARHGLGKRQFDITWYIIRFFEKLGLVSNVKLPTDAAKRRLAIAH
mgnify:CR=1 FL=1